MPKLAELKGAIETRRVFGGCRWVMFVWTRSISCVEIISESVFKSEARALRQANVWAKRLGIKVEGP